jgi:hypothetical protein
MQVNVCAMLRRRPRETAQQVMMALCARRRLD